MLYKTSACIACVCACVNVQICVLVVNGVRILFVLCLREDVLLVIKHIYGKCWGGQGFKVSWKLPA